MKIGTDIVSISRIERAIQKYGDRFCNRFLHQHEIELAHSSASLAGYWAAKEAVSKALGCGIGSQLAFHDIIISKNNRGAPHFTLSPQAQLLHQVIDSSLSISHDGGFAIAVVVLQLANQ